MQLSTLRAISICIGIFVVAMDWAIVNTALVSIQRDFECSFSQLQWIMYAFGLFLAPFLFTMGKLADRYGRKKFYLGGLLLWEIATLLAGLSPNVYFLIVMRGLQGFATAILLPVSQSLVVHAFAEEKKHVATSIWATLLGLGFAIGPGIGGWIVWFFQWRAIFFLSLPFPLISLLMCLQFVEESKNDQEEGKIDKVGVTILFLSLGIFIWSVTEIPTQGFLSVPILTSFLLAIIGFISLIFIELKSRNPLIDFHLFSSRSFFACSIANFSIVFLVWLSFFILPLYMQIYLQLTSFEAGSVMILLSGTMALCSFLTGKMRFPQKLYILIGVTFLSLGSIFQFIGPIVGLWQILLTCVFFGAGWGFTYGPTNALGISSFPKNLSGTATGALTTFQEIGGAVGLAIGGSVLRFFETKHFYTIVSPEGFAEGMRQKIHSILGSPIKAKAYLQTLKSPVLFQDFLDAFLFGYRSAFVLLFIVMFVSALLVLWLTSVKKTSS